MVANVTTEIKLYVNSKLEVYALSYNEQRTLNVERGRSSKYIIIYIEHTKKSNISCSELTQFCYVYTFTYAEAMLEAFGIPLGSMGTSNCIREGFK